MSKNVNKLKNEIFRVGDKIIMKPEIVVVNRDTIEKYIEERDHIVISVHDPYDVKPTMPKNESRLDTEYFKFHDWDDYTKHKLQHEYKDSAKAKKMIYVSEKDAKRIVKFVRFYLGTIDVIICQCDAGISRSAGIAAALSHCIHGTDNEFFIRYHPNRRVYRLILEAWYGYKNKSR